ncbi:hypothetical protein DKT68_27215 [Micromonospora acroterricola]|uniref:Uncharacterized protein n=1 Tax=Micromonospora acroterricola TaxID=2202421 RepID=A0A317CT97_9ACTN|nr:hypothetical protein DKT68_27215 [Micromonospora acroterricola]
MGAPPIADSPADRTAGGAGADDLTEPDAPTEPPAAPAQRPPGPTDAAPAAAVPPRQATRSSTEVAAP